MQGQGWKIRKIATVATNERIDACIGELTFAYK